MIMTASVLLAISLILFQITSPQSNAIQKGTDYLQARDWAKAEAFFSDMVAHDAANKEAWFYVGQAQQEAGKQKEALAAFAKAEGISGALAARLDFRQARAYAALGDKDKAFESLDRAVKLGFYQSQLLNDTREFAALKSDERFAKLLDQIDAALHPCEHDPRYRAFDFWVGDWEVRPTGQPNAKPQRSSIQRILDGCVIFENYTYEGGLYEGKGFNIFDVNTGKWHQTYVDSQGTSHEWDGEVRDDVMYYVGANLTSDGGRSWDKITYFKLDNGHVRHLSQRSKDGGKTWDTYFDGDYRPVNKAAATQN
jgi:tetratricopeptide (TPR) repeat protein